VTLALKAGSKAQGARLDRSAWSRRMPEGLVRIFLDDLKYTAVQGVGRAAVIPCAHRAAVRDPGS